MNVDAAFVRQEASMYDLEKGGLDIIHSIQRGKKQLIRVSWKMQVITERCVQCTLHNFFTGHVVCFK